MPPQRRHRSSRHQARQHLRHQARTRQDSRLRPRQADAGDGKGRQAPEKIDVTAGVSLEYLTSPGQPLGPWPTCRQSRPRAKNSIRVPTCFPSAQSYMKWSPAPFHSTETRRPLSLTPSSIALLYNLCASIPTCPPAGRDHQQGPRKRSGHALSARFGDPQ